MHHRTEYAGNFSIIQNDDVLFQADLILTVNNIILIVKLFHSKGISSSIYFADHLLIKIMFLKFLKLNCGDSPFSYLKVFLIWHDIFSVNFDLDFHACSKFEQKYKSR